jgi:hypothetical protein
MAKLSDLETVFSWFEEAVAMYSASTFMGFPITGKFFHFLRKTFEMEEFAPNLEERFL